MLLVVVPPYYSKGHQIDLEQEFLQQEQLCVNDLCFVQGQFCFYSPSLFANRKHPDLG
jgi:hypothetical protein